MIVDSEEDCYRALGVVHRAWPSVPERFKDFISTPKRNNYRSLHTTVVGPSGMRIEMQIRTEAMDRVAEEGVAAHWRYKDASYGLDAGGTEAAGGRDPLVNLRHLVQVLEHGGDAEELVEHAKLEMFLDQVFVFTPKGKLVSLPRGRHAAGLRLRGPHQRRRHHHRGEDQRRAQAAAHAAQQRRRGRGDPRPKPVVPPDWRSLTVTGRARSAIRRHIRQTETEEFLRLGRASVEQVFERAGKKLARTCRCGRSLERFAVASEEELFEAVGRGRVSPSQVLEAAFPGMKDTDVAAATARRQIEDGTAARLYVRGGGLTPGVSLHFGHCCSPVPGDRIVGILRGRRRGPGRPHHRLRRAGRVRGPRGALARPATGRPRPSARPCRRARLHATIGNAPGVLGQVCTLIGEAGGNIVNLRMHHRRVDFFDVDIDVEVRDAKPPDPHLRRPPRACPPVETVERTRG